MSIILCEWKCYFDQILVGFGVSSYLVRRQLIHLLLGNEKVGDWTGEQVEKEHEREKEQLVTDSTRDFAPYQLYIFITLGSFPFSCYSPIFQIMEVGFRHLKRIPWKSYRIQTRYALTPKSTLFHLYLYVRRMLSVFISRRVICSSTS